MDIAFRKSIILGLFLILGLPSYAQQQLQSPDCKYGFVFEQKNNKLTYRLDYA